MDNHPVTCKCDPCMKALHENARILQRVNREKKAERNRENVRRFFKKNPEANAAAQKRKKAKRIAQKRCPDCNTSMVGQFTRMGRQRIYCDICVARKRGLK